MKKSEDMMPYGKVRNKANQRLTPETLQFFVDDLIALGSGVYVIDEPAEIELSDNSSGDKSSNQSTDRVNNEIVESQLLSC